jgi:hypothetical protein
MTISDFAIRLIFLIIPGVLCTIFYRGFRGKRARKDWEDYLEILAFSVISYLLFEILFWSGGLLTSKIISIDSSTLPSLDFEALRAFLDDKISITKGVLVDIAGASGVSLLVAIALSYLDEFKFLNRIAIRIKATKRLGDESVWYFVHRTSEHWKYVRDHKTNLIYYGWIDRYSDWWGEERELLMKDVIVYNNKTGNELYCVDNLYVLRKAEDLTIEYPNASRSTFKNGQDQLTQKEEKTDVKRRKQDRK